MVHCPTIPKDVLALTVLGQVKATQLQIAGHPLIPRKLTLLHDKNTPSLVSHQSADGFTTLLAYESTRGVRTEEIEVETPLTKTTGRKLTGPDPIVIPILRTGLGTLEDITRLLPTAGVGFLRVKRDE